eukprot:3933415-Rhodomonas_salina.2
MGVDFHLAHLEGSLQRGAADEDELALGGGGAVGLEHAVTNHLDGARLGHGALGRRTVGAEAGARIRGGDVDGEVRGSALGDEAHGPDEPLSVQGDAHPLGVGVRGGDGGLHARGGVVVGGEEDRACVVTLEGRLLRLARSGFARLHEVARRELLRAPQGDGREPVVTDGREPVEEVVIWNSLRAPIIIEKVIKGIVKVVPFNPELAGPVLTPALQGVVVEDRAGVITVWPRHDADSIAILSEGDGVGDGGMFLSGHRIVAAPAPHRFVVEQRAGVIATRADTDSIEVFSPKLDLKKASRVAGPGPAGSVLDTKKATWAELISVVVAPAPGRLVVQQRAGVTLSSGDADSVAAASKVDGIQRVSHLRWVVANIGRTVRGDSELALGITSPALDLVVTKQRAGVFPTKRYADGIEVSKIDCRKIVAHLVVVATRVLVTKSELAVRVVAPAFDLFVLELRADMGATSRDADGVASKVDEREIVTHFVRIVADVVPVYIAPTLHLSVVQQSAGVLSTSRDAVSVQVRSKVHGREVIAHFAEVVTNSVAVHEEIAILVMSSVSDITKFAQSELTRLVFTPTLHCVVVQQGTRMGTPECNLDSTQ